MNDDQNMEQALLTGRKRSKCKEEGEETTLGNEEKKKQMCRTDETYAFYY